MNWKVLLLFSLISFSYVPLEGVRTIVGKYKLEGEDIVSNFSNPISVGKNKYWVIHFEVKGALSLSMVVNAKDGSLEKDKNNVTSALYVEYLAQDVKQKESKSNYFFSMESKLSGLTTQLDQEISNLNSLKNTVNSTEFSTDVSWILDEIDGLIDEADEIATNARDYSENMDLRYKRQLQVFTEPTQANIEKMVADYKEAFGEVEDITNGLDNYLADFESLRNRITMSDLKEEEKFLFDQSLKTVITPQVKQSLESDNKEKKNYISTLEKAKKSEAESMYDNIILRIKRTEYNSKLNALKSDYDLIISNKIYLESKGYGGVSTIERLWKDAEDEINLGKFKDADKTLKSLEQNIKMLKSALVKKEEPKKQDNTIYIAAGLLVILVAAVMKLKGNA